MSDRSQYTIPNENYHLLGTRGRAKFNMRLAWMAEIGEARKIEPACKMIARRVQATPHRISAERLRKLYNRYTREGEAALVDHTLCGGKCGLPGCPGRPEGVLGAETIEAWVKLAEKNDKLSFRWAHRMLIADLRAGKTIAGAGTWRTLFARLYPHKPQPSQCPWSVNRPPPGWSLSNFMLHKPAQHEMDCAKKGLAKAENTLTESLAIRTDLSTLRFMEVIAFDDHRLDCKAYVMRNHNGRMISVLVELWAVFALDLATRTVLAWGVRPRVPREDGTRESLTRRDMQHLIAGLLGTHGFPTDYTCTLLVENAAAAVTAQVESDLLRVTNKRVVIHRAGVGAGHSIGYAEKFGKPRDKRWIESFFNLLEIEIGSIKGQMGNKWENQRGDFKARENIGHKLANLGLIEAIPQAARPFDSIEDVFVQVHDAILRTENREQHELVNFATLREWRVSEADAWKSCDEPFFLALPTEQQNALLAGKATGQTRKETPAERRARLHDPATFERLSEGALAFLYLDVMVIDKYAGADALTFDFAGRTFDFSGSRHSARVGQKLVVRFDADRATHCVLEDEAGRVLGSMQRRRAPGFFEREKIGEQLGERQKALGKMLHNVRTRHADGEQAAALTESARIITAALEKPAAVLPASRKTRAAISAFAEGAEARGSSSEEYLKRGKARRNAEPQSERAAEPQPDEAAPVPAEAFEAPAW